MFARVVAISKQVGVVLGAITGLSAIYMTLGLPMPVSEAAVNAKIGTINGTLLTMQRTQNTILSDVTTVRRQILRNERLALESAIPSASAQNKVAFNLRLGQIDDEIAKLDRRDEQLAKQLDGK